MNVETYIENQIAELEAELSDKRVELASCIQPAAWTASSTPAAKKLDKAYESFCSAIRRRVTWGWFGGTSSIQMGSRTQTYFLKHGAFRLVAAVEQAALVRFPAPGDSTDSIYDYPQLTLSANKVRLIQAYLSLDFDQTSPLSVCYGARWRIVIILSSEVEPAGSPTNCHQTSDRMTPEPSSIAGRNAPMCNQVLAAKPS